MKRILSFMKGRLKSWLGFFRIFNRPQLMPTEAGMTYVMSSLLLSHCYDYLNKSDAESLLYASGFELSEDTLVLDRLVQVEMAQQSWGYVNAETGSSHESLVKMEKFGQKLLALFHIHPGDGEGAAFPSSLDLTTMERFERAGYVTIGAVFSRDGWVQFFSANHKKFNARVFGNGVEQHGDKTFKLTAVS
jgi:proteasome lid subunit RPN8/RPN11